MFKPFVYLFFAVLGSAGANAVLPGVPGHDPSLGTTPAAPSTAAPLGDSRNSLPLAPASLKKLVASGASVLVLNASGTVVGSVNTDGKVILLSGWSTEDIQALQVTSVSGATQMIALTTSTY